MQLPNKLYSYKDSTLALIPSVLAKIKDRPMYVTELYLQMRQSLNEPTDFMSVMDCLFALRAIDINDK